MDERFFDLFVFFLHILSMASFLPFLAVSSCPLIFCKKVYKVTTCLISQFSFHSPYPLLSVITTHTHTQTHSKYSVDRYFGIPNIAITYSFLSFVSSNRYSGLPVAICFSRSLPSRYFQNNLPCLQHSSYRRSLSVPSFLVSDVPPCSLLFSPLSGLFCSTLHILAAFLLLLFPA